VFHTKIVTHFVGDSGRDQTNDIRVIHRDTAGEFEGAYRSFESFANYTALEGNSPVSRNKFIHHCVLLDETNDTDTSVHLRQQLGVIVGNILKQLLPAVA